MNAEPSPSAPRRRRPSLLVLLPLLVFGGLAGVFLYELSFGDGAQTIPSALIGSPAPPTKLPPLEGMRLADGTPLPGIDLPASDGRPVLVNIFASWCVPCRLEHPVLMELAKDTRFRLVGINYKDKPENGRRFLDELGNPYAAVGTDQSGRAGIEWGVYGVPETFLVSGDGRILWKQTGPFTPEDVTRKLYPALEEALASRGNAAGTLTR